MKSIFPHRNKPYSPAKTSAKPLATLEIVKNQANPFSANCTVWEGESSWLGEKDCSRPKLAKEIDNSGSLCTRRPHIVDNTREQCVVCIPAQNTSLT